MKISPTVAGFLKGLFIVIVLSIVSYLGNVAHLTGILNPMLATIVASVFSAIESKMKAKDDGNTAFFGAVKVKKIY